MAKNPKSKYTLGKNLEAKLHIGKDITFLQISSAPDNACQLDKVGLQRGTITSRMRQATKELRSRLDTQCTYITFKIRLRVLLTRNIPLTINFFFFPFLFIYDFKLIIFVFINFD